MAGGPTRRVVLRERGTIGTDGSCADAVVGERAFLDLKEFALRTADPGRTRDPVQVLSLRSRKGREVLEAQSFAGCITARDGTSVEILPKVAGTCAADPRSLLAAMLRTLRSAPCKNMGRSELSAHRAPLYDVFAEMFVSEVEAIARSGLRSGYSPVESNGRAFKGKLIVARDIRANPVNRARVFTKHQVFGLDRPENRILKAALAHLNGRVEGVGLKRRIRRLAERLEDVGAVADVDAEFKRCTGERGTEGYRAALEWARVFLSGRTFSAFSGSTRAEALVFPMERLFEDYIAALMRRELARCPARWEGWRMSRQDTGVRLFDGPNGGVALRPDLVLRNGGATVVIDTKWKLHAKADPRLDRGDLYQMYAYGKRYSARKVVLLYPLAEDGDEGPSAKEWHEDTGGSRVEVRAYFIDLAKVDAGGMARLMGFATGA